VQRGRRQALAIDGMKEATASPRSPGGRQPRVSDSRRRLSACSRYRSGRPSHRRRFTEERWKILAAASDECWISYGPGPVVHRVQPAPPATGRSRSGSRPRRSQGSRVGWVRHVRRPTRPLFAPVPVERNAGGIVNLAQHRRMGGRTQPASESQLPSRLALPIASTTRSVLIVSDFPPAT